MVDVASPDLGPGHVGNFYQLQGALMHDALLGLGGKDGKKMEAPASGLQGGMPGCSGLQVCS